MTTPTPPLSERDRRTLLPCPFCGSPAKLSESFRGYRHSVECTNEDCAVTGPDWAHIDYKDSAKEVAECWNTRAAPQSPSPAVDAGVERVIQWVRDNYQDCNIADLCDGIRAALAAMKETR